MSAYNSGFVTGMNSIGGSSLTPFIPVHERPEELIDGGSAGEHYHLTQAQWDLNNSIQAIPDVVDKITSLATFDQEAALRIYEPVADGAVEELLFEALPDGSLDVMMEFGGYYAT